MHLHTMYYYLRCNHGMNFRMEFRVFINFTGFLKRVLGFTPPCRGKQKTLKVTSTDRTLGLELLRILRKGGISPTSHDLR